MKKEHLIIIFLIWMGAIFIFSSQTGYVSNLISNKVASVIDGNKSFYGTSGASGEYVDKQGNIYKKNKDNYNEKTEQKVNLGIRKIAHMLEYFVLAIIVTLILNRFGMKGENAIIYILFICLFAAVLDEFHQSFVPGRTSQLSDVLIDFTGSLISCLLCYLYLTRKNKKEKD